MVSQKVPLYKHLQAGQCAHHLHGGSLGQDKQLQPLDDGGVDSPPPPILEAVYYWMWCQSPVVVSTVATGV